MKKKEQWSSGFGFIMAAAGSAIGLGNLWKFPYITGTNGGGLFLLIYVIFLILLGIPILLAETAIGRYAGMNAVDSCSKIRKGWGFVGGIGILGAFTILAGYNVVGGWVIKYILSSLNGNNSVVFTEYTSKTYEPLVWTLVFSVVTAVIVLKGVSGGIEKVSSVLLPVLLFFLIGLMIYSLTLPNAIEGVKYFLVPDLSGIDSIGDIAIIALNAMGQVFFSLSLGMGTLITYGSYLDKSSNLTANTITIVILDTLVAVISALVIIPAVFSFGMEITSGPGLIFSTLPHVFSQMIGGRYAAALFFILVFFAAITSAISLLEVVTSWFESKSGLSRSVSTAICSASAFAVSSIASLSFGALSGFTVGDMIFFDVINYAADKIIMPVGGFFLCILVGYIWSIESASEEISNNGKLKFRFKPIFAAAIKYVAPALILIIFISSIFFSV